ncbi:Hypothetical protein A7982_00116 [Minicystis rosea]|nr:Hypothetical protein A7982_00116 [Minicystis rosea]
MHTDRRSPRPPLLRRAGAFIASAMVLSAAYSCSLIIDNRSEQCQGDADCSAGFRCDLTDHVCVGSAGTGGTGGMSTSSSSTTTSSSSGTMTCDVDGGIQGGGCYGCTPKEGDPAVNEQLLNQCSDAQCFPFDNKARIAALADGGKLPSLPPPDGGL